MKVLLILAAAVLLTGCKSGYTRDGVTVMSYCLLGGVYVDDTQTTYETEAEPPAAASCEVKR